MENLSNETKTHYAIQLVIMDAIEKGKTDSKNLIAYMQTNVFKNAVKNYLDLFN
jgi:hypothetical protein